MSLRVKGEIGETSEIGRVQPTGSRVVHLLAWRKESNQSTTNRLKSYALEQFARDRICIPSS